MHKRSPFILRAAENTEIALDAAPLVLLLVLLRVVLADPLGHADGGGDGGDAEEAEQS